MGEGEEGEDRESPNYEEKAQEIVQSVLQEVVNTVAGGEPAPTSSLARFETKRFISPKIDFNEYILCLTLSLTLII